MGGVRAWPAGCSEMYGEASPSHLPAPLPPARPLQPNLGQGGCMAIEDAYELANDLSDAFDRAGGVPAKVRQGSRFTGFPSRRGLFASGVFPGLPA